MVSGFISKPFEPIGWFLLFIGLTALIVLFGVEKGVEKVSKWMMPILVLLTVVIAIYGLFMPGAIDGLVYYVKPDFSKFSATTILSIINPVPLIAEERPIFILALLKKKFCK